MEDRGLVGARSLVIKECEVEAGRGEGEGGNEGGRETHAERRLGAWEGLSSDPAVRCRGGAWLVTCSGKC